MRNPFYINFLWLGSIIILLFFILFGSGVCECKYPCFDFENNLENVLLGILSSAILLFLAELILFIRDGIRFGFLSGQYKRIEIYQINAERKQWHEDEIKTDPTSGEQFEYKKDSIYHRLMIYDSQIETLKINIKYLHSGKYVGKADYNEGSADITTSLDTTNETQGKGIYQYYRRKNNKLPDIGTYEIQVKHSENHTLLYVYYKNTIPTGAAEGYEVWEKY